MSERDSNQTIIFLLLRFSVSFFVVGLLAAFAYQLWAWMNGKRSGL